MKKVIVLALAAICASCGSSSSPAAPSSSASPAAATPAPTGTIGTSVTETFTGTISGGDNSSCVWSGTQPFELKNAPCSIHTITVGASGVLSATVTYNSQQALLLFGIYDPTQHRTLANGTLDTTGSPTYKDTLSTNIQAGSYQLQISEIRISAVTPYTITVTHPR